MYPSSLWYIIYTLKWDNRLLASNAAKVQVPLAFHESLTITLLPFEVSLYANTLVRSITQDCCVKYKVNNKCCSVLFIVDSVWAYFVPKCNNFISKTS
jgi:hypothetical protein